MPQNIALSLPTRAPTPCVESCPWQFDLRDNSKKPQKQQRMLNKDVGIYFQKISENALIEWVLSEI